VTSVDVTSDVTRVEDHIGTTVAATMRRLEILIGKVLGPAPREADDLVDTDGTGPGTPARWWLK
jgi:hypothetical protein